MWQYNARWTVGLSTAFRCGVAVLSVTAALGFAVLLQTHLRTEPFASSFLCAVMFASWLGGAGSDLLAAGLAVLAFIYYAAAPTHTFYMAPTEIPRVVVFTASTLFVVWISAAHRAAAIALQRSHDDLRTAMERFRTLVQFSFDVYWETDAQHRFIRQEFAEDLADAPGAGRRTRQDALGSAAPGA
jgi:K+-sensing histidine kinase KdpD